MHFIHHLEGQRQMTIELGGNIRLSGFKDIDGGTMIILKKIIGNYVRRMSESSKEVEDVDIILKRVHLNRKFEVHAKVVSGGRVINSAVTEHNIFFSVDKALSSVMVQMEKP